MALRRIGQILVDLGYISDEQLELLVEEQQQRPGQLLGQVALDMALVNDEQLARFVNLVESLPERGPELAATFRAQLKWTIGSTRDNAPPLPATDTERRALVDRLLTLAHEHDDGPATLDEMIASLSKYENPPIP